MKNSTNKGFDQHCNVPTVTDQERLLIGGNSLSDQTNDPVEMEPALDAISTTVGKPSAAALDNGYFCQANIKKTGRTGGWSILSQRKVTSTFKAGKNGCLKHQSLFQMMPA